MKEQINELRSKGYSYNEISKKLNCSKGTIAYFLNPSVKEKKQARQTQNRRNLKIEMVNLLGGKCCICGYNKCVRALHFHHKNPSTKLFEITSAIWGNKSKLDIISEVKKCDLLCANCHAEKH